MGIYIKNMKMPMNCWSCRMFYNCYACEGHYCRCAALGEVIGKKDSEVLRDKRRDDCPLVPVPPHGDLIDRDVLLKKCEFACTDDDEDVRVVRYGAIESAPTIIPAELA